MVKRNQNVKAMKAASPAVPKLLASKCSFEAFSAAFQEHCVVLVKGCLQRKAPVGLAEVRRLYGSHPKMVHKTFSMEGTESKDTVVAARRVLGASSSASPAAPWYASFIVQKNPAALKDFMQALPFAEPPFLKTKRSQVRHSNAVWVFVGRNSGVGPLRGRPEHTDALEHSGTWHLQLRGTKVWKIRPTDELRKRCPSLKSVKSVKVRCEEGDVLCINTRLWWHQTYLPGRCGISMSIARDVRLGDMAKEQVKCDMTNIEGHFATRAIPKGTVVFTEDDAPDCQLPRSRTPNCELGELPDGTMALVSKREIKKGEWFSMAPSDDEEEDGAGKRRRKS
eukprot:TRINITY_DN44946_c0_g2_i2.p1 TRINITY_DN44946_c0_g2~~TRINITY_DN44946_c0_g2_i2.p1  ORF type:complete len:337 (-),score=48.52 TRINITY_DN44946_c0_g2_i2:423-1433(-)